MLPRTLIVLCCLLVHAAAFAQFAGRTPRRRAGAPEERNRCPVPTLDQCLSADYLENDPCGILQTQNEWTCSELLAEAADAEGTPGELSIIAYNINALGVDPEVKKLGLVEPLADQALYYEPDLFAITSQAAAKNFVPGPAVIGVDIYASWDNSAAVNSCTEYVYEKFFDQAVFERLVGMQQHDSRKVYEIAFGPGYREEAIGTRHLSDPVLRGFDGRGYASMFTGAQRPKNAFFGLPLYASLPGRAPVEGAPNLGLTLQHFNFLMPILFGLMDQNDGDVAESWAFHKTMSESLSVEGAPQFGLLAPGLDEPTSPFGLAASAGANEEETLSVLTGSVPKDVSGGKPLRRYLDAELDELYAKQQRLRRLIREWALLDIRYAGSGWTPAQLDGTPPPDDDDDEPSVGGLVALQPSDPGASGAFTTQAGGPGLPPGLPGRLRNPGTSGETAERRRVLQEMANLYEEAASHGCLNAGLTPCDWSPKLFARAVLHRFSDRRDAAFAKCSEYVPQADFTPIKNLHIPVIDEPATVNGQQNPLAQYNCTIQTGSTITAAGLEQLFDDVDTCRDLYPTYLEAKAAYLEAQAELEALQAARARAHAIPELVDPATGEVRPPGIGDGRSESKGNKYFGLSYDWGYGFSADYEQNECDLQLFAGGHFELLAHVLTKDLEIIDALAEVDSDDRSVDIHARLLGINLFTPVDQTIPLGSQERIEFGTVQDSESGGDNMGVAALTIFIGPIPLKLQVGVAGTAGIDFDFGGFVQGFGLGGSNQDNCPRGGVLASVYPAVHLEGFAQASVDIGLAEAGVRGELLIVDANARFAADLALAFDANNDHELEFPKNLKLEVAARLGASADTLEGNVKLYGRIGVCPFCKKAEKTLVAWDGYSYEREFFDQRYGVYLGDLLAAAAE